MGILTAAGLDADSVWAAIREGKSGLGPLTTFPSPRWASQPIGEIRDDLHAMGAPRAGSRSHQLAWLAIRQAIAQAQWGENDGDWNRSTGLILGATTGGVRGTESVLEDWLVRKAFLPRPLKWHDCASTTDLCARRFDLGGPTTTVSTACSSGALAIAMAAEMLLAGEADRMIAGGVDSLCRLTLNGFNSLMLVDAAGCRPFDANRSGMNLGEGAAALTLELEENARRRGATILARLTGWGTTSDAYHVTAPHPEGVGAASAMRQALESGGLRPEAIDYVNAHGTGTPDNDPAEAAAMRSVFGDNVPAFSSTKAFFGHTLAASGAVEAVVSLLVLIKGELPPNLGFEQEDPAIGLSPLTELTPCRAKHVMSNSFGFGGNNAALIFSHAEPAAPTRETSRAEALNFPSEIVVTGMGVISEIGCTPKELFTALNSRARVPSDAERIVLPLAPETEESKRWGRTVEWPRLELPEKEELDARKRRRLNHLLKMAVIAARRARAPSERAEIPEDRIALCIGTGLGCLTDTVEFLSNMILKDEKTPMPAKFINSVHNAPASQAAMELGAKGLNSAPTHREISFESALWQSITEIRSGRADLAYAGACDEMSPYYMDAGFARGWWPPDAGPHVPFDLEADRSDMPLAGEGAALVSLARGEAAAKPLARVGPCALGRWSRLPDGSIDAEAEAAWIESTLARAGVGLDQIDLVLSGADGRTKVDAMYLRTHATLERRAGRGVPIAAYKHLCGDFASASAVGFVLAVGIVQGKVEVDRLRLAPGSPVITPCRTVLLSTLSPGGSRAITCVRAMD